MIRRLFKVRGGGLFNAQPTWNGAPTDQLMVVRRNPETGENSLDRLFWGLIPNWSKDRKKAAAFINARCETAASLPAFRDAWRKNRRCLVPVDGFYEWTGPKEAREPYAFAMAGEPMALAGLWENWKEPESGEWLRSFTILTGEPNGLVAQLHNRMPVIVPEESWEHWLSGEDATDLMTPIAAERMQMWPVSTEVNNSRNEGPQLFERAA